MPLIEAKPEITQNYPTAVSENGDYHMPIVHRAAIH